MRHTGTFRGLMFAAVLVLGGSGGTACVPAASMTPAAPTDAIEAPRFVLHLRTGTRLEGVDGIILPGRVQGRSAQSLLDVDRLDIKTIYVSNRTKAPEYALLGAATGAVMGLLVSAAAMAEQPASSHLSGSEVIGGTTAITSALFAGVFTLIGLNRPKWDEIR